MKGTHSRPLEGDTQHDPRYQELCTRQMRDLQEFISKQARERVLLALQIGKEKDK